MSNSSTPSAASSAASSEASSPADPSAITPSSRSSTSASNSSLPTFLPGQISRIAIIGAGPVGLAFAKYFLSENTFSDITIYEQRDNVGGVWNLSGNVTSLDVPVPQNDPFFGTDVWLNGSKGAKGEGIGADISNSDALEFESPLYEYLETNIPKQLMAFSDTPFPEEEPLFPGHEAVLKYLENYAKDVRHLIRLQTKVRNVQLRSEVVDGQRSRKDNWVVTSSDLSTGIESREIYDALVVANGHYTVPYIPAIPGLEEFTKRYTSDEVLVLHSKAYRRPQDFSNKKKVLVIGNSASGLDIASQIGKFAKGPVWLSARSESVFGTMGTVDWRRDVGEVAEFLVPVEATGIGELRAVKFRDGHIETGFDAVVFATGYFYNFPFLQNLDREHQLGQGGPLITDGFRTRGLYQHLFHIEHPSLVFPVVNLKVIPFPLSQNQAAVVSRVWAGRLDLPDTDEMWRWERETVQRKGDGKGFHLKKFPEDAAQVNDLFMWAERARRGDHGLKGNGFGRAGTVWDERLVWMRSKFPAIKAAFAEKGKARETVTTMEELGFNFEAWRKAAKGEDLRMFIEARCPDSM